MMINFPQKSVSKLTIQYIFIFVNILYVVIGMGYSIYDFSNKEYITWRNSENQTHVYSSRRSTTITYNFVKDSVRISREYPGILEGINTWLWGIDKKKKHEDISFFVRAQDYNKKMKNNAVEYRKTIFGTQTKEIKSIPFFGLRKAGVQSSTFWLILDIWKYNYSWMVAICIFFIQFGVEYILNRFKLLKVREDEGEKESKMMGTSLKILFVILFFNLLV